MPVRKHLERKKKKTFKKSRRKKKQEKKKIKTLSQNGREAQKAGRMQRAFHRIQA